MKIFSFCLLLLTQKRAVAFHPKPVFDRLTKQKAKRMDGLDKKTLATNELAVGVK